MRKKSKPVPPPSPVEPPVAAGKNYWLILALLCAFAFCLRIVFVRLQADIDHPDEIFQTVEQAHRMVFGYGIIPWEFQYGLRSPILPFLLSLVMRVGNLFASGSGHIWAAQIFLALASVSLVYVAFRWGLEIDGLRGALLAGFFAATSSDLVHMGSRALSEVFAANLLCLGLLLVCPDRPRTFRQYVAAGILLGCSVVFRLQLAPAVAVVFLWTCRTLWRERWFPMMSGALGAIVLGNGLVDWLVYGVPFHSPYTYFLVNQMYKVQEVFGMEPGSFYLDTLKWFGYLSPALIPIVYGAVRLPQAGLAAVTILISHSMVSHKEPRFVFPMVALFVILLPLGVSALLARLRLKPSIRLGAMLAAAVLWCGYSALLLASARVASTETRNLIHAFDALRQESGLCGVGFYRSSPMYTPGYFRLHRDVPWYVFTSPRDPVADGRHFNFAISAVRIDYSAFGFRLWRAVGDEHWIYRREGACEPGGPRVLYATAPDAVVNSPLRRILGP